MCAGNSRLPPAASGTTPDGCYARGTSATWTWGRRRPIRRQGHCGLNHRTNVADLWGSATLRGAGSGTHTVGRLLMEDAVLAVEGAAQLLNVSHDTIYRLARDAAIPGRKVGNQWRFSRAALLAWLRDAPPTGRPPSSAAVGSPNNVNSTICESPPETRHHGVRDGRI